MKRIQQVPPRAARMRRASASAAAGANQPSSSTLPAALVCAFLLMLTLPPNLNYGALVNTGTSSVADTNFTSKVIVVVVLLGSCVLIAQRQRLWVAVLRSLNPFYLLYLGLATLSIIWSIDAGATERSLLRMYTIFLCFTAFTLNDWRTSRFQDVLRPLFGVLAVGSVAFAVLIPHYGVQQYIDYNLQPGVAATAIIRPVLRGLTFGKNQMGQLASLALVLWFHAWLGKEVKTRWVLLCCACSVIGLYWAHSSTSILAAAFSLPIMLMLRHWPLWLRRYMPYILAIFSVVILGYSLVVLKLIPQLDFLLSPITALTGKDLTFSNRTAIWAIVADHIAKSPIAGTGYGAYWNENDPRSPSQIVKTLLFFFPGESHNGYIEVINDLGIIGGLCLMGYLFTFLRQAIKIMGFDRHQGSLYIGILFHQFWSNLSESHWLSPGSVSFTVQTLACCCAARTLLQRQFELNAPTGAVRPAPTPKAVGRTASGRRRRPEPTRS